MPPSFEFPLQTGHLDQVSGADPASPDGRPDSFRSVAVRGGFLDQACCINFFRLS
jgi:hypothetical protein